MTYDNNGMLKNNFNSVRLDRNEKLLHKTKRITKLFKRTQIN